jgi:hypothetical protein
MLSVSRTTVVPYEGRAETRRKCKDSLNIAESVNGRCEDLYMLFFNLYKYRG